MMNENQEYLKLRVDDGKIITVNKDTFYKKNVIIRRLILHNNNEEYLSLPEGCKEVGIYALERFYNNEDIELNNNSCVDILETAIALNDVKLIKKCENYIIENIYNLFNIINDKNSIRKCRYLKRLNERLKEYECEYEYKNNLESDSKHVNSPSEKDNINEITTEFDLEMIISKYYDGTAYLDINSIINIFR